MKKERINEIVGIFFLAIALFFFWSLMTYDVADSSFFTSHPNAILKNGAGLVGAYLSNFLILSFGVSAYVFPFIFIFWAVSFLLQKMPEKVIFKLLGFFIFQSSTAVLLVLLSETDKQFPMGGIWGYILGSNLEKYFGLGGGLIIAAAFFVLSFILATEFLVFPYVAKGFILLTHFVKFLCSATKEKMFALFHRNEDEYEYVEEDYEEEEVKPKKKSKIKKDKKDVKKNKPKSKSRANNDETDVNESGIKNSIDAFFENIPKLKVKQYDPRAIEKKITEQNKKSTDSDSDSLDGEKKKTKTRAKTRKISLQKKAKMDEVKEQESVVSVYSELNETEIPFEFPPLELLQKPEAIKIDDDLAGNSRILEDCLMQFGIKVKVVEVEQGPVITRYELLPAPGVKVSRITSLQDDVALAMKAPSIRMIAPIPGKSAVGIEVPNSTVNKVYLRELLQFASQKRNIKLPLVLGKDTSGKVLVGDLADMPHMLIAGATGSGKTVCINTLIVGLIYSLSPDDLKFIMVDPKRVELACYNDIPHLLSPVVTNPKKASATLNWVVDEMDNRYKLFAKVGMRNIQSYNSRSIEDDPVEEGSDSENKKFPVSIPYIVVIVDELADLMMVAADKVETSIARLAQLARATGIHLVLATQRPSVDVITGVIKSNFPARVSFKVSSKTDSRTVLDANGADKLLGKGDMLFLKPGRDKPIRAQGALISDPEINSIVDFVKEQKKPIYNKSIQDAANGKSGNKNIDRDELFDECVRIVIEANQASVSLLQRRLRIGYTRAARIVDQLEAEGIVGPYQGSKPREILVTDIDEDEYEDSNAPEEDDLETDEDDVFEEDSDDGEEYEYEEVEEDDDENDSDEESDDEYEEVEEEDELEV